MTSSPHGLYVPGYTRATMGGTEGSDPAKASESQKSVLSSDCSLQLDCMKVESLVTADQHAAVASRSHWPLSRYSCSARHGPTLSAKARRSWNWRSREFFERWESILPNGMTWGTSCWSTPRKLERLTGTNSAIWPLHPNASGKNASSHSTVTSTSFRPMSTTGKTHRPHLNKPAGQLLRLERC